MVRIYRVVSWIGIRTSEGGYELSECTEACYMSLEEARKYIDSAYEKDLKKALEDEGLCAYYSRDEIVKMFHKEDGAYRFTESDDSWNDNGMSIEQMKLFETFLEYDEEP